MRNIMNLFIKISVLMAVLLTTIPFSFTEEPPQQGTIIPCEECVILYPEKYVGNPKSCPVCGGKKEHFQPARMMVGELITVEARELELKIEKYMIETLLGAHEKLITVKTLNEIRELYKKKLMFHLTYSKFELEPIKAYLLELNELIEKLKDE